MSLILFYDHKKKVIDNLTSWIYDKEMFERMQFFRQFVLELQIHSIDKNCKFNKA